MQIIEMVYSSDPDRIEFLKNKLSNPYASKEKKQSIAFVSNRNGNSDIFEIQTDGTNLKPLLNGNSNQWSPRATVDGNYLYYLADKDSIQAIYRYNLRNDKNEFIKEISFDDFYFQLHPLENKIVAHDTIDGYFQLFIYDFDNDSVHRISFDSSNNKKPVFMNDGYRIVFQSDRKGNEDLFLLNLKNDSLINLTNSEWNERNPSVSPYDDVIVFHSDQDSLDYINLYYLELNSGEIGQLTNSPGMELIASFSPDAKDLVFGSNRDDNWEIYLMSNRGKFKDRLTNHPSFDGDAVYINRPYLKK
ncbi:MAG: DPP IV N-terminal domain-containing protein, partial [Cytophagales bacterium]